VLRGTPDEEHLGEHGGSDSYVLLEGNLPKHRHRVHGTDHNATPANTDYTAGEYGTYIENYAWTDYAGKENPDSVPTVPTYVNVQFCMKK
jgi:microcystin-dependent protein